MSKVATYLRGHVAGEVSVRNDVREAMSTDTGVLQMKPDMVIYPRHTNDIRKVLRFTWQLAEKGHVLPVTVRGAGTDGTGAAIGNGIVIATTSHMNHVFEYDEKQKLVRLQAGASVLALSQALALHGSDIMALRGSHPSGTVGGAIASAVTGPYAGKYGTIEQAIDQLEVVLANGDILQTKRINRTDLNKHKGLETLEGDIYRGIDTVIEEYADVLDSLRSNDAVGYNTIADVKQKDGSFDLTPLFVGSQGTLGVICEMIMRSDFKSSHHSVAAFVFADDNVARDALDGIVAARPALVDYFDADLFDSAVAAGRTYQFYTSATEYMKPAAVIIVEFDEFSGSKNMKQVKKLVKEFEKHDGVQITVAHAHEADELLAACDVAQYTIWPDQDSHAVPSFYSGFHVPTSRLEDFLQALRELARKEHMALPLSGHVITNTYSVYPAFDLKKTGDKQKVFTLLDDLTKLVYLYGGTLIAEGGEGRLRSRAIYRELDDRVIEMYEKIRSICDPRGTLNPGVKQPNEAHALAPHVRDTHAAGQFARFGL